MTSSTLRMACWGVIFLQAACASVTPGHRDSGWRNDGDSHGGRAKERTLVLAINRGESTQIATAGAELLVGIVGVAVNLAFKAFQSDIRRAAARHAALYDGSSYVQNFYGKDGKPLLEHIAIVRELRIPKHDCKSALLNENAQGIHAVIGGIIRDISEKETTDQPDDSEAWCPVFAVAFEVDFESDTGQQTYRVRPMENSMILERTRAKVVSPSWFAPWTWYADKKNRRWWAPTWGTKNYLDLLEITIEFTPLGTGPNMNLLSDDGTRRRTTWRFKEVPLSKTPFRNDRSPRWSDRHPLIPHGVNVLSKPNDDTFRFTIAGGPYAIRARVVEQDDMADRLSDASQIIGDLSKGASSAASDAVKGEFKKKKKPPKTGKPLETD